MMIARLFLVLLMAFCVVAPASAEEPVVDKKKLYTQLEKQLTGAKFKGRFTVQGKENDTPKEEEYTISSAIKAEVGEMWLLNARIKYGEHDVSIPVPIEIQWAATTPVMVMDKITLPGLGTFSARVVIHGERYAGTWQHDKVGGHLFGTITTPEPAAEKQ
jgi:hypothetical protein